MSITVEQLLQFLQLASKEFSLPSITAVLAVVLAQWLAPSSISAYGAIGFLSGTIIVQARSWFRSRNLPFVAYLCIINQKLNHSIVFDRHQEHSMFRQTHFCQTCGNPLIRQCPRCGYEIALRSRNEKIGSFCRNCGKRLFRKA
jgi:hypothetical protein